MAQGVWVKVFPPPPVVKPELPGLGGWADITAVMGSPKKHEYTDVDGVDWTAYKWTSNGSVTLTDGLIDTLVVGGGSGWDTRVASGHSGATGMGGQILYGLTKLQPPGTFTIEVGVGGTADGSAAGAAGGVSRIGTFSVGQQGPGWHTTPMASNLEAFETTITGAPMKVSGVFSGATYGEGAGTASQALAGNRGQQGVVIVRVPRANAKA